MVNRYIKELLIESNRVIVPDFGAFIARVTSESREPNSLEHKTIVFNDILKFNDGLLVNYIIKVENADLTIALQKINDFIQLVTDEFVKGNDYLFEGIGLLHRDKRGNITLISKDDNLNSTSVISSEVTTVKTEKQEEKIDTLPIPERQNNFIPVDIPPVIEVINSVPPPLPEKEDIVVPPPIPPPVIAEIKADTQLPTKDEMENVPVEIPVNDTKKEYIPEIVAIEKDTLKAEAVEKKSEKKVPEIKIKPVKPVKKETSTQGIKKKSPAWIAIVVWSVSGLLFLSLIFMASVKFGFVKGVKLFSQDEWVSVNDKLQKDLKEYNKKHKDNLTLSELKKDDNNKGAFSSGETGSTGSFDEPANDAKSLEKTNVATTSSGEGSSGSFDTPADSKTTKEQKLVATKTETKATVDNTQSSTSNNGAGASGKYILVAGSFSSKNSAEIFVEQLRKKGFTTAEYVGIKNGTHMVCYGSFNDQNEANAEYQKLQQKAVQTWILKQ